MAHCPSCGGVIGKDCFNPVECAWITEQQESQRYQSQQSVISETKNYDEIISYQQSHIESLEKRIIDLEYITKHLILQ